MSSGSAAKDNFTGTISAETRTVPPSAPLAGSAKLDLSSVPSSMASSANGTGSTKALSSRFLETIFEKTFGKKSAQELSLSSDKEWQSLLAQRRSQNEDAKRVADSVDDNDEKIDISVPTSATSSTSSKHAHQSDIKIAANAAAKTAELVSVLESERAWLEKERGVTLLRRPGLPTAQMRMERAAHERRRALEIAKSRDLIRSIYKKTVPRRKQELADDDPNRFPLGHLMDDMVFSVFCYLPVWDIANCFLVCRAFTAPADDALVAGFYSLFGELPFAFQRKTMYKMLGKAHSPNGRNWSDLFLWSCAKGFTQYVDRVLADKPMLGEMKGGVTTQRPDGYSGLHLSAEHGQLTVLAMLLRAGADLTKLSKTNKHALHTAAERGQRETMAYLLDHYAQQKIAFDLNMVDDEGQTPLYVAASRGHAPVVQLLITHEADEQICQQDGKSPLFGAAEAGHTAVCKLLLESKSDVRLAAETGKTPLYAAAENGHAETVDLLLRMGSDVRQETFRQKTPLYPAAEQGHVEVVKHLLRYCNVADLFKLTHYGTTPMYIAAKQPSKEVKKLFMQFCLSQPVMSPEESKELENRNNGGASSPSPAIVTSAASIARRSGSPVPPVRLSAAAAVQEASLNGDSGNGSAPTENLGNMSKLTPEQQNALLAVALKLKTPRYLEDLEAFQRQTALRMSPTITGKASGMKRRPPMPLPLPAAAMRMAGGPSPSPSPAPGAGSGSPRSPTDLASSPYGVPASQRSSMLSRSPNSPHRSGRNRESASPDTGDPQQNASPRQAPPRSRSRGAAESKAELNRRTKSARAGLGRDDAAGPAAFAGSQSVKVIKKPKSKSVKRAMLAGAMSSPNLEQNRASHADSASSEDESEDDDAAQAPQSRVESKLDLTAAPPAPAADSADSEEKKVEDAVGTPASPIAHSSFGSEHYERLERDRQRIQREVRALGRAVTSTTSSSLDLAGSGSEETKTSDDNAGAERKADQNRAARVSFAEESSSLTDAAAGSTPVEDTTDSTSAQQPVTSETDYAKSVVTAPVIDTAEKQRQRIRQREIMERREAERKERQESWRRLLAGGNGSSQSRARLGTSGAAGAGSAGSDDEGTWRTAGRRASQKAAEARAARSSKAGASAKSDDESNVTVGVELPVASEITQRPAAPVAAVASTLAGDQSDPDIEHVAVTAPARVDAQPSVKPDSRLLEYLARLEERNKAIKAEHERLASEAEKARRTVRRASKKAAAQAILEAQQRASEAVEAGDDSNAMPKSPRSVEADMVSTAVTAPPQQFDPSPYLQGVAVKSFAQSKKAGKKAQGKGSKRARKPLDATDQNTSSSNGATLESMPVPQDTTVKDGTPAMVKAESNVSMVDSDAGNSSAAPSASPSQDNFRAVPFNAAHVGKSGSHLSVVTVTSSEADGTHALVTSAETQQQQTAGHVHRPSQSSSQGMRSISRGSSGRPESSTNDASEHNGAHHPHMQRSSRRTPSLIGMISGHVQEVSSGHAGGTVVRSGSRLSSMSQPSSASATAQNNVNLPAGNDTYSYMHMASASFPASMGAGAASLGLAITGTSFGVVTAPAGRPAQQYAMASVKRRSHSVKRPEHVNAALSNSSQPAHHNISVKDDTAVVHKKHAVAGAHHDLAKGFTIAPVQSTVTVTSTTTSAPTAAEQPATSSPSPSIENAAPVSAPQEAPAAVPAVQTITRTSSRGDGARPMSADSRLMRQSSGKLDTAFTSSHAVTRSVLGAAGQSIIREASVGSNSGENAPDLVALSRSRDSIAVAAAEPINNTSEPLGSDSAGPDGSVSLFRISRSTEFGSSNRNSRGQLQAAAAATTAATGTVPSGRKASATSVADSHSVTTGTVGGTSLSSVSSGMINSSSSASDLGAFSNSSSAAHHKSRGHSVSSDPRTEMVGSVARKQELLNRLMSLYSGGGGANLLKLTTITAASTAGTTGNAATGGNSGLTNSLSSTHIGSNVKAGRSSNSTVAAANNAPSLFSLSTNGPLKAFPLAAHR